MPDTASTFADHLYQFAMSIDIVDDATFDRVKDLVGNYMRQELDASYFALMVRQPVNERRGLQTIWSSDGNDRAVTITDADGAYAQQVCLAYDKRQPLWVVSGDKEALRDTISFVDQWSGVTDLPRYASSVAPAMKTSIMVPLVSSGRRQGVMCLESPAYVEAIDVAKAELDQLAAALAALVELRNVHRSQARSTKTAVGRLQNFAGDSKVRRLTKPVLFVASSDRADDDVVGGVHEVLREHATRVDIVHWKEMDDSGTITSQIANTIVASRFGVCYLSEPAPAESEHRYQDNPNVIFEAGMLHAMVNAPDAAPSGWIPIREEDSPAPPFDFASERIVEVPRDASGSLDRTHLRHRLRRRVLALLQLDD